MNLLIMGLLIQRLMKFYNFQKIMKKKNKKLIALIKQLINWKREIFY